MLNVNAERLRPNAHVRLPRRHPPLSKRTSYRRSGVREAINGQHCNGGVYTRHRAYRCVVGQRDRCGAYLVLSCVCALCMTLRWSEVDLTWMWM